jgi:hypothetical protein
MKNIDEQQRLVADKCARFKQSRPTPGPIQRCGRVTDPRIVIVVVPDFPASNHNRKSETKSP